MGQSGRAVDQREEAMDEANARVPEISIPALAYGVRSWQPLRIVDKYMGDAAVGGVPERLLHLVGASAHPDDDHSF